MTKSLYALGVCVLALVFASCSGGGGKKSSPTTTATNAELTGTVVGTVREVGGPAPGLNRQIAGNVTALSTSGKRWRAATTATREFSLDLPPGTYRFTGTSPVINSGHSQCLARSPVVVVRTKTTAVEVVCDIE